ncbi:hypothetical protein OH76DRAFT_1478011 [Lentinus brumalis]|uniref:F-box domain-containing protein n=1 Tax=Lentinus brumalis TaxID=2498619 RepID=A0A371DS27_9APHY|nr:hypothetical protein OH76DRAFT_1478011 [Polyporus brumalis]
MERLHVETLRHIFALSCCDGGLTGRALSLVSKAFQAAARPVRYHSIALVGLERIECFLRCYQGDRAVCERQGLRCSPTVRHLFLRPDATDANGVDDAAHGATAQETLCDVLRLVGPTLVTLLYTGEVRWEDILAESRCEFPKLEELTFSRRDSFELYPPSGRPPYLRPPCDFPVLRELHVVFVRSRYPVEDVLGRWAEAAPSVSHVRLSGLRSADMPTRWVIKMSWQSREKRPYPSVRQVVIQPHERPPQTRCGHARGDYDAMVLMLRKRLSKIPKDISGVLLSGDIWGRTFWEDWIQGVHGGPSGVPKADVQR